MKMANDGVIHLAELLDDRLFLRQKWQRGGIVTEQNDSLLRRDAVERVANLGEMGVSQFAPNRKFVGQRFRLVNRQGDERGGHSQEQKFFELDFPKWFQPEIFGCAMKTGHAQSAVLSDHAEFAQLVIAEDGVKFVTELVSQLRQAYLNTFERRLVADAYEAGVHAVDRKS